MTMVEMDTCHKIPDTLSLSIVEFIIMVLMVEVKLVIKRPANLPLTILDKELMLKVDVPTTIP